MISFYVLICLSSTVAAFSPVTHQSAILEGWSGTKQPPITNRHFLDGHTWNSPDTSNSFQRRQLQPKYHLGHQYQNLSCRSRSRRSQLQLDAAPPALPIIRSVWWEPVQALAAAAGVKFVSQWRTYCLIPVIAGLVGWVTNYLAVKMSKSCKMLGSDNV